MINSKFNLDNHAHEIGASFCNICIRVNPKIFCKRFEAYIVNCDDKVSRHWTFVYRDKNNIKHIINVYDWKETSLYSKDLPTPEEYWSGDSVCLHLGHLQGDLFIAREFQEYIEYICGERYILDCEFDSLLKAA